MQDKPNLGVFTNRVLWKKNRKNRGNRKATLSIFGILRTVN